MGLTPSQVPRPMGWTQFCTTHAWMDYIWRRQPHGSSTPRGIAEHINGVNRGRVTILSTPPVQSCPDKVVNRMGRQPQGALASMLVASTASVWQFRPPHAYKCILLTSSTASASQFCLPHNCKCDLIRSSTAWARQPICENMTILSRKN